jgi:hypothetical protein
MQGQHSYQQESDSSQVLSSTLYSKNQLQPSLKFGSSSSYHLSLDGNDFDGLSPKLLQESFSYQEELTRKSEIFSKKSEDIARNPEISANMSIKESGDSNNLLKKKN